MTDDLPAGCRLLRFAVRGDARGSLVALESNQDIPFAIARTYYVYGTGEGVARGFHAHRRLVQVAVPVSGSCTMVLDDARRRCSVRLDDPAKGLLIGPMIWREMRDFTPDCVLLVLADAPYDESEYIRDYAVFAGEAASGAQ